MRETHIKQMEVTEECTGEEPPKPVITICPELSVEPLVTSYLRRAYSYNFIHQVLLDTFGKENLRKIYRLTPDGPVKINLDKELTYMESLFYGAACLASYEIGMKPALPPEYTPSVGKNVALKTVVEWKADIDKDIDLTRDNRMMVPVFYDIQREMTKVWVFMGYEIEPLIVSFKSRPGVAVFDKDGRKLSKNEVDLEYESSRKNLICPVFAEVYTKEILNREEFQALCDKYASSSEILGVLQE